MLDALARAVRETPFSAVVQNLRVKVLPLKDGDEKHIYEARVIQAIRGPKLQKLEYFLVAEAGEMPTLTKTPVIVTLCKNDKGYYWPGVGAEFPKTADTLAVIGKVKPELKGDQKQFADCD